MSTLASARCRTARRWAPRLRWLLLAEAYLEKWCRWARQSALAPMKRLADTLWRHRAGLLRWYFSEISNGILEGINSLLQAAKARARGPA